MKNRLSKLEHFMKCAPCEKLREVLPSFEEEFASNLLREEKKRASLVVL